ncbi:phasin family protein [Sulfitobacter sp. LCG007]
MDGIVGEPAETGTASSGAPETLELLGASFLNDLLIEGTRFLAERLQEDMNMQREALACRDPTRLLALQFAYWQTAAAQYGAQAVRLSELANRHVAEIRAQRRPRGGRRCDDFPI